MLLVSIRSCQIDYLFSVTGALAKKLGTLNLFIQKLARRSFIIYYRQKKEHFSYVLKNELKDIKELLIRKNSPHPGKMFHLSEILKE